MHSDNNLNHLVAAEFRRECSVRRTAKVLEAKRRRIRADLEQLVGHMALLVPQVPKPEGSDPNSDPYADMMAEALNRLGDEAFTELVMQVLHRLH
ncbi:hypothetical protein HC928_25040 [bacterium]|nr:hypothetical protein [bacterium]